MKNIKNKLIICFLAVMIFTGISAWSQDHEYLVITTEALQDTAERLQDFRQSQGFTTGLVTLENIILNYVGVDPAEKIRECVDDYYNNHNTRFVLLAGDTNLIPARQLLVSLDGDIENHARKEDKILSIMAPSDIYYTCLDGSFNSDGDAFWGEITDGDGGGIPDWEPELAIGRLPAGTPYELDMMINKIVKYETNHVDKKDLLLAGLNLSEDKKGDGTGIPLFGKDLLESLYSTAFPSSLNYTRTTHYEADGVYSGDDVVNSLNTNNHDIVLNAQHANPGSIMKMLGVDWDTTNDLAPASDLTNSEPFLVFTGGCEAACYKTIDGFNEYLTVKNPFGAYAYIGSSSYGYFGNTIAPITSYSYMNSFLDTMFARRLSTDRRDRALGTLLNEARMAQFGVLSKADIETAYFNTYNGAREMHYNMTLVGDPLSVLLKENLTDLPSATTPYLKTLDPYGKLFNVGINKTGLSIYSLGDNKETVVDFGNDPSGVPYGYDFAIFDKDPTTVEPIDHVTYYYNILGQGVTNYITIGTDSIAPWFIVRNWSPPQEGEYHILARAFDSTGGIVGEEQFFLRATVRTKPAAEQPWIVFEKPEYRVGQPIFLRTIASDADGWVEYLNYKVTYTRDSSASYGSPTIVFDDIDWGAGNKEPYNAAVSAQHIDFENGAKTYHEIAFKAVAFDNYYTESDPSTEYVHQFTVVEHNPSTITIDSPATSSTFHMGQPITVDITAEDLLNWDDKESGLGSVVYEITNTADGSLYIPPGFPDTNGDGVGNQYDFYLDPKAAFPQSFTFTAGMSGSFKIKAIATDYDGIPRSAQITFDVIEYNPPSISIVSPANGDVLNIDTPAVVEIMAEDLLNWNDDPGALAWVNYEIRDSLGNLVLPVEAVDLNGDGAINEADMYLDVTSSFPQSLSFTPGMRNSYTIVARAFDSDGILREANSAFQVINPDDPFSFERPGKPWTSPTANLTEDHSNKTEGAFSLVINNTDNMVITSPVFSTEDFDILSRDVSLDIYMPSAIVPNPAGYGTIAFYINDYILGTIDLSTLSAHLGTWTTVGFLVPEGLLNRLKESHSNMTARIIINTQQTGERYQIDNLRFSGSVFERFFNLPQNLVPGTTLEAEDFDFGGLYNAYYDTTNDNQGGSYRDSFVDIGTSNRISGNPGYTLGWTESGEWLQYTINVNQSANYNFHLAYAALEEEASFHLEIDGNRVTDTVVLPATGDWETWTWLTIPDFHMTLGQHNLRIVIDSPGFNLDCFYFSQLSRYAYSTMNIPGTIEAEYYDVGGEGVAYHDNDYLNQGEAMSRNNRVDIAGDNEGGYVVGYISNGEWLEYTIASVDAGVYDIDIVFACNDDQGGKGINVSLDGNFLGNASLWNTGGWEQWQTVTIPDVSIPAASYVVLRLDFQGDNYNLNRIIIDNNLLVNGDFSNNLNNWNLGVHDGASATYQNISGKMEASISYGGTQPWNVQVTQSGLTIEAGKTYDISFDAMADISRTINMNVGMDHDPYISYGGDDFTLTTTMTTFSYSFTMAENSDNNARFEFNLGANDANVTIDNVRIVERFDPNMIVNGHFTANLDHWNINTFDGASARFENNGGQLGAIIDWGGAENWNVQVTQNNLTIESGKSYIFSFDARATNSRSINVNLGMANDPYTSYGGDDFSLTTTMSSYSYVFTMTEATDNNSRFELNLGISSEDVFIDNIRLEEF